MPKGIYKRTKPGWNKGLTKETDVRVAKSAAVLFATLLVKYPKPILEAKLCECGCGEYASPGNRFIYRHNWKGKKHSKKTIELMSAAKMGIPKSPEHKIATKEACNRLEYLESISGKNSVHFIDGLSNINHLNFNESFRKKIRDRDIVCQLCGKTNIENINETTMILSVHHIHYDPETNDCSNNEDFITLCISCHMKTNVNREYWTSYFLMQKLLVA